MKLKLIGAALSVALLCTACGAPAASQADPTPIPVATPEPIHSELFKDASSYDYENFTDSQGIDESGMFTGVKALDYVTLPENYKELTLAAADLEPTEADVKAAMDDFIGQYLPAANGDTVNIDYVGSVDGIEFVGGNTDGNGADVVLGSRTFIDGFEEQIVGHKAGDHFDITVTFPEGYNDSTDGAGNPVVLAGKEAVFAITVNHIHYAAAPTDAWVKETLEAEYDMSTVEQLQNYVVNAIKESRVEAYGVAKVMQSATFSEPLPESVMDYMVCRYLHTMNQLAAYENVSLEEFLRSRQFASIDELLAYAETEIVGAAKSQLVMQAIAEDNNLTLDANEAAKYDKFVEGYGQPYVNQYALNRQVITLMAKCVTITK